MTIDATRIPPDMMGSTLLALVHLAAHGAVKLTDLARHCRFTTAAATGLMDRLEAQGLARRNASADRRVVLAAITPEGRLFVEGLRPAAADAARPLEG